jgi:hypothetical protein
VNFIVCFNVDFVQAFQIHPVYGARWNRLKCVRVQQSAIKWEFVAIEKFRYNCVVVIKLEITVGSFNHSRVCHLWPQCSSGN